MLGTSESLARRAAELAERATGPRPESWRPDKPELLHPNPIVGVLLRVVDGPDRGYGPTKIAELRDVDGRAWAVWLLGHVLLQEFLESASAPAPGELVAVRYEGRRTKKTPKPGETSEYESYRVVIDRGDGAGDVAPAVEQPSTCEACGWGDGHATGCPLDDSIPF